MYSDDPNHIHFDFVDISEFAPDALKKLSDFGMDTLSLNPDGSLMLGWYMRADYVPEFETYERYNRDYFMIGKTDAKLTQCDVLYAAGDK